jgi:L-arabinonolactonase
MIEVEVLTPALTTLGESALWDAEAERLWWADTLSGTIFRSTHEGGELRVWSFPGIVTSLALRTDGGVVVTSRSRIHLFDLATGETELVHEVAPIDGAGFNFNDAVVDRQGRFLTALVDPALSVPDAHALVGSVEPRGAVLRLDPDLAVHDLGARVGLSNGPCTSPDGATVYWGDSWARVIHAFDYDLTSGTVTATRPLVDFDADSAPGGPAAVPDGSTVDADGGIWVAACHGGEVRRYAPDGALDRRIPVPVSDPTSVAIGGPGLDTVYVTSMRGSPASGEAANAGPLAGVVLAIHGTGVRGVPETRFAG